MEGDSQLTGRGKKLIKTKKEIVDTYERERESWIAMKRKRLIKNKRKERKKRV